MIPEGKINEEKEKIIKRSEKVDYIFRAYLYAGYDFCTEENEYEKIESKLELNLNGQQFFLEEEPVVGRNPVWNKVI